MGAPTTTTALHQSQLQQLHSKEVTSKPFPPKTPTSATTPAKWAAAATPTAPARSAPALRAPAPAANKQILSPTDLRSHHPPAPQCHSITSAFTIVISARETCEWIFFGTCRSKAQWIACRSGSEGRLTKIRDYQKLGGQRTWVTTMYFRFYLLLMNPKEIRP